jgi:hypothetical protein
VADLDAQKFLPYLVAAGGLFFGALFIFLGTRLWKSSRELATTGITVKANITKKFRREEGATWGGLENTFILIRYTDVSGRERTGEVKVATKVWGQLKEGGTFGVSYLPAQPDKVYPHPVIAHKIRCWVAFALIGIGALALVIFPVAAFREIGTRPPAEPRASTSG